MPDEYFGSKSGEDTLLVRDGEVLTGVLDKNAFGKYGLVHAVQELYGNADAGRLLSALSRLCTNYLQQHGFSCGLDDMLLQPAAEANRKQMLGTANDATHRAAEEFAYAGVAPVAETLRPSAAVREQLESRLRERAGCAHQSAHPPTLPLTAPPPVGRVSHPLAPFRTSVGRCDSPALIPLCISLRSFIAEPRLGWT